MAEKLWRWLLFGVLIALLPIGLKAIYCVTHNDRSFAWSYLLGHGELLLISVGISSRAVGELLANSSHSQRKKRRLVCGGICVILTILGAFVFADISAGYDATQQIAQVATSAGPAPTTKHPLNNNGIVLVSTVLYLASFVCGACSIILTEDS